MAGVSSTSGRKNVDVSNIFFINMLSKAFAAVIILFLVVPKGKPDKPLKDTIEKGIVDCGNFNAYLKSNETKIPKDVLEKLKQYQADFEKTFKDLEEQTKALAGDRDLWKKRALAAEDSLSRYKCGPGYRFDKKEGRCILDTDCPKGQHWDAKKNICVDNIKDVATDTTSKCPAGQRWDDVTKKCVDLHQCPDGEYWNEEQGKCIKIPPCSATDPLAFVINWQNKDDEVDLYMTKGGDTKAAYVGGKRFADMQWKKMGKSSQKVYKSNAADGDYDIYIHYYKKSGKKTTSADKVNVELSWAFNPQNANTSNAGGYNSKKNKDVAPPTSNSNLKRKCQGEGTAELTGGIKEPFKKDNSMQKLGTLSIKGGVPSFTFNNSGQYKLIK